MERYELIDLEEIGKEREKKEEKERRGVIRIKEVIERMRDRIEIKEENIERKDLLNDIAFYLKENICEMLKLISFFIFSFFTFIFPINYAFLILSFFLFIMLFYKRI